MSETCSGLKLPPLCEDVCPCDPVNTDRCERSGYCHCKSPFCGPRCLDTGCAGGSSDIGKIIGAVIGGVVLLAFIIFVVVFLLRRKRRQEEKQSMEEAANKHIFKGSHSNVFPFDKNGSDYLHEVKVEQSSPTMPSPIPQEDSGDEDSDIDAGHDELAEEEMPETTSTRAPLVFSSTPADNSVHGKAYKPSQIAPPEQFPLIRRVSPPELITTGGSKHGSVSSQDSRKVSTVTRQVVVAQQSYSIQHHSRPPTEYHQATPIQIARPEDEDDSSGSNGSGYAARGGAYSVRQAQTPQKNGRPSYQSTH